VAVFRDAAHAAEFIGDFFREEAIDGGRFFAGSGVIYLYNLTDLGVRITVDASIEPAPGRKFAVYVNDPAAPEPTAEFLADSETFRKVYRGDAQPLPLMAMGKIKTKGNVVAAMRTLPAMAILTAHYKAYSEKHGLK
jgi:hypothetical protein